VITTKRVKSSYRQAQNHNYVIPAMNLPRRDDKDDERRKNPTAIETEIAQELARLPVLDQLRTSQDIEGKNLLAAAEPCKLVQLGLDALDKRIREQIRTSSEPSVTALLQSSFARDRKLCLKILRAENFDSELAVKRMVDFLSLLQEVIGSRDETANVLRPLELTDFTQEERGRQDLGALQLLLFRDQAGRRVAGCFDVATPTSSIDTNLEVSNAVRTLADLSSSQLTSVTSHGKPSLLKEAFYLFQAASEDETTQKEGLVFIFMVTSNKSAMVKGIMPRILSQIFQSGPLRVAAVHVCSPDLPELHNATAKLVRQFDARDRIKVRLHYGMFLTTLTWIGIRVTSECS
jgi:uncharacterized protein YunC (DUF1805 family)